MFSKHSSSGWILLGTNLILLKYFDITWPRHKSSKIEGSCPPWKIYSIQFRCVCFRFSTVSKRETIYTRCYMKGINVPSHLQSFAGVQFDFREKFAKNCKKSQKIDLNRIIRQRIFRFEKSNFFESMPKTLPSVCPRMEKSNLIERTVWCVVNMFHKNGMRPLIITNGKKCYSILYCNSP